jgi:hypothetical protein
MDALKGLSPDTWKSAVIMADKVLPRLLFNASEKNSRFAEKIFGKA